MKSISVSREDLLAYGLIGVMIIIAGQLFYLQVLRHDHYSRIASEQQIAREVILPARGEIFARERDGVVPLVLNETVYTVFADPREVEDIDKVTAAIRRIAGGEAVSGFDDRLGDRDLRYVPMARQVTRAQAEMIREEDLAGVGFQESTRRVYPEGQLASQLLGFVNTQGEGQYGLEEFLDADLAGEPGRLESVTDVRRIPLTIGEDDVRVPARDGDNLVLSIDRSIQSQAEKLLREGLDKAKATNGSVVVMDPRNGGVLAMANYPTYDPARYFEVSDQSLYLNSVVSFPYENGSVMKTLTVGAGLDSGAVSQSSTFDNLGYVIVDDTRIENVEEDPIFPNTTMTDILHYSLNTGVVYILEQMGGGRVNAQARQTLYGYFHDKYGLGQLTGIEQAGEAKGRVWGPDESYGPNVRYANMTFGQGMDTTMIQTAAAFSASINGGDYYRPSLIQGVRSADGRVSDRQPELVRSSVLKPDISLQLRQMIRDGRKAGLFGNNDPEGYMIGGKTGTSEVIDPETGKYIDDNSIGTYLGFGGTDEPRYVIMVRVQDSKLPGYAGTTAAAPIFNELSSWMLEYLRLPPKG